MPAQMFGLISTVLAMALSPLWPAYGEAIARGDHDWVKQTLYRSIILSVGVAACLSVGVGDFRTMAAQAMGGEGNQPTISAYSGSRRLESRRSRGQRDSDVFEWRKYCSRTDRFGDNNGCGNHQL